MIDGITPVQTIIFIILLIVSFIFGLMIPKIILCFHNFKLSKKAEDTTEEIMSMVNEGQETGVFLASEAEMISNIFEFSDKEASDIMTNRANMVAIDQDTSLKEAVDFMLSQSYSRYPVFWENIDHIIGVLYLKDAFRFLQNEKNENRSIKSIKGLLREVTYIPETRKIDPLFHFMQSQKIHFAIVSDEYGQTSGILTMEDILEEIVGNIFDEYDDIEKVVEKKGIDQYETDGLTSLHDLGQALNIDFSEEPFETINGLMISRLEHIPDEGEEFSMDYHGYKFSILTVENKTIKRILITKEKCITEGE